MRSIDPRHGRTSPPDAMHRSETSRDIPNRSDPSIRDVEGATRPVRPPHTEREAPEPREAALKPRARGNNSLSDGTALVYTRQHALFCRRIRGEPQESSPHKRPLPIQRGLHDLAPFDTDYAPRDSRAMYAPGGLAVRSSHRLRTQRCRLSRQRYDRSSWCKGGPGRLGRFPDRRHNSGLIRRLQHRRGDVHDASRGPPGRGRNAAVAGHRL